MAPATKTARKVKDKKVSQSSKAPAFPPLEPESDHELQLATKQNESDFEGFEQDEDAHDDESEDSDGIMDIEDNEPEKDESEEELERLIFGDSAGFKAGLKDFSLDPSSAAVDGEDEDRAEDEEDLEGIADQDLFFFDSGPGIAPTGALVPAKADEEEKEEEGDKPAWEDSDDDRLVVSLASVPRLRKLRETEEEDVVTGKEYVRRLRKQYNRLYPTPEWAIQASGKAKRKRAKATKEGDSDDNEASDMDVDDDEDNDDLSTQPLARLLKDADILSKNSRGPAKRRKLQAGVVDIQRLKDVSKKGPVGRSPLRVQTDLLICAL